MKKTLFLLGLLFCSLTFFGQTTFSCTSASTVCPCGGYGGSYAEYYAGYFADNQSYFTSNSPGITRNDPKIDFTADNSWGSIVPPASGSNANPDTYSTRWSGSMLLAAGTYSFWLTSDDASWFWLGGNAQAANPTNATAFINNGGLHSAVTVMSTASLATTCRIDFKVHFGEQGGQNRCNLEYASTALGITRQAVPAAAFCPCMSTASLPITLNNFYVLANKDNVTVYWKTDTEKNNNLFRVHKSGDGINWSVLGEQAGGGTTHQAREYTMIDRNPLPGINYYYLEQVDFDGGSERFPTQVVDFSKSDNYLRLFPNPFLDKLTLVSSTEWNMEDSIEALDAFGKPVAVKITKVDKFTIDVNTANLPQGQYILRIKTPYQVITKKLVKN